MNSTGDGLVRGDASPVARLVGLKSTFKSCFLNSVLQALAYSGCFDARGATHSWRGARGATPEGPQSGWTRTNTTPNDTKANAAV